MVDINYLGNVIRNERKKQGLTQEQLASVTGVGVRFIREIENGKNTAQIGKLLHVMAMLGIKVSITTNTTFM